MCGEKCATRWQKPKALGSPPRMRGKAVAIFRQLHHGRITPAYAGKSDPEKQPGAARWDHPRVCGEKKRLQPTITAQPGSPPRMRGKAIQSRPDYPDNGITPAYAGKSPQGLRTAVHSRDHPRVCGEKARTLIVQNEPQGSPPRMRGKALTDPCIALCHGITPACAGKRRSIGRLSQPTRDHPRVCGEKCSSVRSASHRRGSPPRMRGKDLPFTCDCESTGITPACAGKSLRPDNNPSTSWDHPRVCGEKTKKIP